MRPSAVLKEEHRLIERTLNVLEAWLKELEKGEEVPSHIFEEILELIHGLIEGSHKRKEEKILFRMVEESGSPREESPLKGILNDHEEGRKYIRNFEGALKSYKEGNRLVVETIIKNARSYIALLKQHIPREDDILYPMAERVIPEERKEELEEKLKEMEEETLGKGKREKFLWSLARLEKEVGL